jgi:hypothetical protein
MGTIVGSEVSGVGVAPGAKWFAAKGCGTILCSEADLTGSAQFALCPTRLDGSAPDCSQGADVVSNSWGGGNGDDWYSSYVDAWRDAGMIPVFVRIPSFSITKREDTILKKHKQTQTQKQNQTKILNK